MAMTYFVDRTCTEVKDDDLQPQSYSLEELRPLGAVVLLGDPGSGKTTAFDQESKATGGKYISARDFMTFDASPEWRGRTLFIDALDETRAGKRDGRTPLDEIRVRLSRMDLPSFRISCRDADWLGASDRESLRQVARNGNLSVFRLDPLTEDQIVEILLGETISNPQDFLLSARKHGLHDLLGNPQTLKLLAKASAGRGLPDSREEVFRLSCKTLIEEHNQEHQAASRQTMPATTLLLDAASYLCAVYLIADITGFTMSESTDGGVVSVQDISRENLPLREALGRNVFTSRDGRVFSPSHRSVAEYLGAKFLADVVRKGLPIGRVLALICGADGGVVAGLRGLHAWLAFHSAEHRGQLCDSDPLGIILYGAPGNFPITHKKRLLSGVHREIERSAGFSLADWNAPMPSALATGDMVDVFTSILMAPSRTQKDQLLTRFVLDAVRSGTPLPELNGTLMQVIRDGSRWPHVRQRALEALIHVSASDTDALLQLAHDIRDDKVEDPEDGILGQLLNTLFPRKIEPSTVLNFLHSPKRDSFVGGYYVFWSSRLAEEIGVYDIPALLDALASRVNLWDEQKSNLMLERLVRKLLVKGIEAYGDKIPAQQLLSWLTIPIGKYEHSHLDGATKVFIREWLESRPRRYQELVGITIENYRSESDLRQGMYGNLSRFCGALPAGMTEFWLQLAEHEIDLDRAEFFFIQATDLWRHPNKGQTLEFFESWVASRSAFIPALDRARYHEIRKEHVENQRKWAIDEEREKKERIASFRQGLVGIRPELVRADLLHYLAAAYFGNLIGAEGQSPMERLSDFLAEELELVSASIEALKKSLERSGLPSVHEIVGLAAKDEMHFVRLPALAAMEEIYGPDPAKVDTLSDDVLSKVLAFRFTEGTGNEPDWLNRVIEKRPELVARILVAYGSTMLRAGKEHIHGLYALAFDDQYSQVARLALPELLDAFPTRLGKGQLISLEYVLKAALRYADRMVLEKSIERKLRLRSLDVAQHVYWLACAWVVDPLRYQKNLERYLGKSHERREHLGAFLAGGENREVLPEDAPPETLGLLARLLGPGCSPDGPEWLSPTMRTAGLIGSLIDRLSNMADESAARELEQLAANTGLAHWKDRLQRALYSQQVSQREAGFSIPPLDRVLETLNKGKPANAADLAALTLDALKEIADDTRNGNADSYKFYWNLGPYDRPESERSENACRDELLSRLRDRLKVLGIDVQPEGHYADDKRADLKVTYSAPGFAVSIPIEIKKDSHADLWRSISSQLVPRYTRDPESAGCGIYLVFWFGGLNIPRPPRGNKPRSAEELQGQLDAIIEKERHALISTIVFDCADHQATPA